MVVVGWAGDPPGEGAGALLGKALDHAGEGMADPLWGEGGSGIATRAITVHAAGLQEGVILHKLGLTFGHVDGEGLAAVLAQEGEESRA